MSLAYMRTRAVYPQISLVIEFDSTHALKVCECEDSPYFEVHFAGWLLGLGLCFYSLLRFTSTPSFARTKGYIDVTYFGPSTVDLNFCFGGVLRKRSFWARY